MYKYALKEYLEMLIEANDSNKVHMDKDKAHFYNAFGKILNVGEITDKDRNVVLEYITEKYGDSINRFQEPELGSLIEYFQ
jgi:hypothetical protein